MLSFRVPALSHSGFQESVQFCTPQLARRLLDTGFRRICQKPQASAPVDSVHRLEDCGRFGREFSHFRYPAILKW
jgi:hypothetical protein